MDRRELYHQWAHQTRLRRKAGNLSYDGPTLYSYRTAIAHIHARKVKGALFRFVLMCQQQYSKTTATHKSAARGAVSHLPLAEVPHIRPLSAREHGENLDAILADMAELLGKAQRALRWHDWRSERAGALHDTATAYARFFKVRRKVPAFPQAAWEAARERARRIENPDPASLDKRERARAARKAAQEVRERKARELAVVHDAAWRSDWRLGNAFGTVGYSRPGGPVMLRLNGEQIETSHGARIPAAAAPMVWRMVEHARCGGGRIEVRDARGKVRIGDYPLDRIDADGTLHAGCHTIPYSELAMMARTLGLEKGN